MVLTGMNVCISHWGMDSKVSTSAELLSNIVVYVYDKNCRAVVLWQNTFYRFLWDKLCSREPPKVESSDLFYSVLGHIAGQNES